MDCKQAQGLLSAYIDQMLEPAIKRSLDEHLAVCRDCPGKIEELVKYTRDLAGLKKVKAPDDFLQKVNQRISRRSEFERMTRNMFSLGKIKTPLEAAGVLATVVLIIAVVKMIEPGMKYSTKNDLSVYSRIQEAPTALSVDNEAGVNSQSLAVKENAEVGTKAAQDTLSVLKVYDLSLIIEESNLSLDEAVEKIKEAVTLESGTLVSVAAGKDNLTREIILNLPAENYPAFFNRLKTLSIILEPFPEVPTEGSESVSLSLNLTLSK